jgi:hypothetical protein
MSHASLRKMVVHLVSPVKLSRYLGMQDKTYHLEPPLGLALGLVRRSGLLRRQRFRNFVWDGLSSPAFLNQHLSLFRFRSSKSGGLSFDVRYEKRYELITGIFQVRKVL